MLPKRAFLISVLVCGLCACGWQLRGVHSGATAFDALSYQQIPRSEALANVFKRVAHERNIRLQPDADLILTIHKSQHQQRSQSITRQGITAQYRIELEITYSLRSKQHGNIIQDRHVKQAGTYDFEPVQVVSKNREADDLLKRLQKAALHQILTDSHRALLETTIKLEATAKEATNTHLPLESVPQPETQEAPALWRV